MYIIYKKRQYGKNDLTCESPAHSYTPIVGQAKQVQCI